MDVLGASADFSTASNPVDQIKDLTGLGSLVAFEQVAGGPVVAFATVLFDLTSIPLTNGGVGFGNCASNAAFKSCSPAGSPFTLSEDASGTQLTISFAALMNAYTGTSASGFTPYKGIFSTQLSGVVIGLGACNGVTANITNIVACEGAGGTIDTTWSATEAPVTSATAVPEPMSIALLGSGLLGLGVSRRRRSAS